jgi:hypothetical protein
MAASRTDAPETARALSAGRLCEGCGAELHGGRPQRRHCDGRCRALASRERKARDVADTIARLARLAGVGGRDPKRG